MARQRGIDNSAYNGAMTKFIPYGKQCIDDDDIDAVAKILRSDWLTTGPAVQQFEEAFAAYCGAQFAVAVSSGTAALHLAMMALGIGPGDAVITSPITFLASANCARYCGAEVFFADIDPQTACLSASEVDELLQTHTNIKAIIPIDFGGHPADLEGIRKIANTYKVSIVEDACHAVGSKFKDSQDKMQTSGNCNYADLTVFSLHPVKHITSGEGGIVTTNDPQLYKQLQRGRNHGMVREPEDFINKKLAFDTDGQANVWYSEMQSLGYNYRITDFQCALAHNQLTKIDDFVARRRQIAAQYRQKLGNVANVQLLADYPNAYNSYHLFVALLDFDAIGKSRNQVMQELRAQNIGTQVHYLPVFLQPYYQERAAYNPQDFPKSMHYYKHALSLPMYYSLTDTDIATVTNTLCKVIVAVAE